jgi:Mor family transcriptional regulator
MGYITNSVWEQELIELVGEDGLLALEERWGGTYLTVHVDAHTQPELINAIGDKPAEQLSAVYGGFSIYIPTKLKRIRRNIQIQRDGKNTGVTLEELAAKYRLTTRRIKDILREEHNYNA